MSEVKVVTGELVDGRAGQVPAQLPARLQVMAQAGDEQAGGFKSRQEAAREACEAAGIVWPGTILPPGTALWDSGVEKLRSDRATWKRLPLAAEVVGLVEAALSAEDRKDYPAVVSGLRLRPTDGRIVQAQNLGRAVVTGLGYNAHTLRQLVAQVGPLDDAPRGFASALLYLSDRERAEIVNARLDEMAKRDKGETEVTLRTRLPHVGDGSRIARAALSKTYGSIPDADIARALGAVLRRGQDRTGRMDYKPGDSRSRFEVIWPSEIPVETFVVGDVHYACLSITNSETGEGSLRIAPAVVRARCANLTVSVGEGTEVVLRHVGDARALAARLVRAIELAVGDLQPLLEVIHQSARVSLPETWTATKAFEAIARKHSLPAAAVPSWLETWKRQYSPELLAAQGAVTQVTELERPTVWSLTAAITEAAQGRESWADTAEWERCASEVQAASVKAWRGGAGDPFGKAVAKH